MCFYIIGLRYISMFILALSKNDSLPKHSLVLLQPTLITPNTDVYTCSPNEFLIEPNTRVRIWEWYWLSWVSEWQCVWVCVCEWVWVCVSVCEWVSEYWLCVWVRICVSVWVCVHMSVGGQNATYIWHGYQCDTASWVMICWRPGILSSINGATLIEDIHAFTHSHEKTEVPLLHFWHWSCCYACTGKALIYVYTCIIHYTRLHRHHTIYWYTGSPSTPHSHHTTHSYTRSHITLHSTLRCDHNYFIFRAGWIDELLTIPHSMITDLCFQVHWTPFQGSFVHLAPCSILASHSRACYTYHI